MLIQLNFILKSIDKLCILPKTWLGIKNNLSPNNNAPGGCYIQIQQKLAFNNIAVENRYISNYKK